MSGRGAIVLALAAATGCAHEPTVVSPGAPSHAAAPDVSTDDVDDASEPSTAPSESDAVDDAIPVTAIATAAAIPPPTGAALLAEANRELSVMQTSVYSHHTHVDESGGQFDYDCSGFVEYALGRAAPVALAALVESTVKRPLAKHLVAFFDQVRDGGARGGWHALVRATDLAPGDVIAWLRPRDSRSRNTGHVLIVRGAPRADPARGGVIVPIIDSTSVRHGRDDSRRSTHASGLGTGEIVLVVDDAGRPVGYRWSLGSRASVHLTPVALGRLGP